jgi:hypothetical protein
VLCCAIGVLALAAASLARRLWSLAGGLATIAVLAIVSAAFAVALTRHFGVHHPVSQAGHRLPEAVLTASICASGTASRAVDTSTITAMRSRDIQRKPLHANDLRQPADQGPG